MYDSEEYRPPADSNPFSNGNVPHPFPEEDDIKPIQRLLDVFRAPSRLSKSLLKKTGLDLLLPLSILLLLGILVSSIRTDRLAYYSSQLTEENSQQEQNSEGASDTKKDESDIFESLLMNKVLFITLFIQNRLIHIFLATAMLYILGRFVFKREESLLKYLNLVCYGCVIAAAGQFIQLIDMLVPFLRFAHYLNLSFLFHNHMSILSYLLSDLDLFSVWLMVYYGIGLATFASASRKKTIVWILAIHILLSLSTPIRLGYPLI